MSCVDRRIDGYLRSVARRLGGKGEEPPDPASELVLVRGSPAVDPDSLAGSLAYAFLLAVEGERRSKSGQALVIPFVPIARKELRLRPEVLALLAAAEIPGGTLVDSALLDPLGHPPERLSLVLVDWDGRELPRVLQGRVIEIVDHHPPSTELPATVRRLVAPVGSVCTLVTEQILERSPRLLERRLALLLLGPILLDTVDLDAAVGRATERDREAASRLRTVAGARANRLFEELREARTRLDGLTGGDLLRRDFKAGSEGGLDYGVASVPVSARDWLSRESEPEACLRRFAEERGLDLLLVMFAFRESGGEFRRQLLVQVRGESRYDALLDFLGRLMLDLRAPERRPGRLRGSGPSGEEEWRLGLFEQGEVGFSRKRLEPELRRFCETLGAGNRGG